MGILSKIPVALIGGLLSICALQVSTVRAGDLEEGRAAIERGNYEKAVRLLMPLAERGDPTAQNAVGVLYLKGWGLNKNPQEAIAWFRRAAEQGELKAYMSLGVVHERGLGVSQNCAEAVRWYREAAVRGWTPAQVNLGAMYDEPRECLEQDYAEALKWYRKAAEQGDAVGQNNLGQMYYNGKGVEQDFAEALKWYRKAAGQGNAAAQGNLGHMYFAGEGVKQDFNEAIRWFRLAAEQGRVNAQVQLGTMFELGLGAPRDVAEAVKWYRMAADQGDPGAMRRVQALMGSAAPEALRIPSLDEALAASATDLAMGLHLTKQYTRFILPLAEAGAKLETGLMPGLVIDRNNVGMVRSVLESRSEIYETAARQRGYDKIAGHYRSKATASCARIASAWAAGIRAGDIRELEIRQADFDIQLVHRPDFDVPGVVVESVLVFTDPMNSDYPFVGMIKAKALTIRPGEGVLAAWPGGFRAPSRKDLENCRITLDPRN